MHNTQCFISFHCTDIMTTVHYTMYTVPCTMYIVHYTPYTVQCTLYDVYCTLYIVHCTCHYTSTMKRCYILYCNYITLYNYTQCALHIVYNGQWTMYIVQCPLYKAYVKYLLAYGSDL